MHIRRQALRCRAARSLIHDVVTITTPTITISVNTLTSPSNPSTYLNCAYGPTTQSSQTGWAYRVGQLYGHHLPLWKLYHQQGFLTVSSAARSSRLSGIVESRCFSSLGFDDIKAMTHTSVQRLLSESLYLAVGLSIATSPPPKSLSIQQLGPICLLWPLGYPHSQSY